MCSLIGVYCLAVPLLFIVIYLILCCFVVCFIYIQMVYYKGVVLQFLLGCNFCPCIQDLLIVMHSCGHFKREKKSQFQDLIFIPKSLKPDLKCNHDFHLIVLICRINLT